MRCETPDLSADTKHPATITSFDDHGREFSFGARPRVKLVIDGGRQKFFFFLIFCTLNGQSAGPKTKTTKNKYKAMYLFQLSIKRKRSFKNDVLKFISIKLATCVVSRESRGLFSAKVSLVIHLFMLLTGLSRHNDLHLFVLCYENLFHHLGVKLRSRSKSDKQKSINSIGLFLFSSRNAVYRQICGVIAELRLHFKGVIP